MDGDEDEDEQPSWITVGAVIGFVIFLQMLTMIGESRNEWPTSPPGSTPTIGRETPPPMTCRVSPEGAVCVPDALDVPR